VQNLNIILKSKRDSRDVFLVQSLKKKSLINLNAILFFEDQQRWNLLKMVQVVESPPIDPDDSQRQKFLYLISPRENWLVTPTLTATIYIARQPCFYLVNAFFFIFLITLTTFSAFSINFYSPHFRLATTLTILLTSISFKWVVNRSLPPISSFHSLDAYHLSSVCFICVLIAWHSFIGTQMLGNASSETCRIVDLYACVGFLFVFSVKQCAFVVVLLGGLWTRRHFYESENIFLDEYKAHVRHVPIDSNTDKQVKVELFKRDEKEDEKSLFYYFEKYF